MRAGAAELDRASLACPVGFIPSLRSTKHREADLLQLFFQLEDLHLVGPHLQSLNLSNCNELTRIHLKRPSLVSLNLSLLRYDRLLLATPQRSLFLLVKGSLPRSVQTIEGKLIPLSVGSNDEP
jgi:hypothetical protein